MAKLQPVENLTVSTIRSFQRETGYNPSFRDIAERTGLPLGTVHAIVVDLAERGEIKYTPNIARSISV
jgi:DNA-binding IclR family transcriptional regulator